MSNNQMRGIPTELGRLAAMGELLVTENKQSKDRVVPCRATS